MSVFIHFLVSFFSEINPRGNFECVIIKRQLASPNTGIIRIKGFLYQGFTKLKPEVQIWKLNQKRVL